MTPGHVAFVIWSLIMFGAGFWIGARMCRQAMIVEAERLRAERKQT